MSARSMILLGSLLLAQMFIMKCDNDPKSTESPASPQERSSHHHHESPTFQGFWKKKFIWRPRWVKTWQEKKVYVAVWKRMWGPAEVKEWVPVPKPPPGWVKNVPGSHFVKVGLPH
ncbi:uncharacterized protein LOC113404230 [Vanessa tameamea]|uniref:Uncharacterized protein LOC113404230 n=1 Tax=Vanessa tameamea TaxID=334116 RepID=A0A8B8IUN3_VANTA|nr:uncharacterized protein LOC113404230 [Vanessa tameamea]